MGRHGKQNGNRGGAGDGHIYLKVQPAALDGRVGEEDWTAKHVSAKPPQRAERHIPKVTSNPVLLDWVHVSESDHRRPYACGVLTGRRVRSH